MHRHLWCEHNGAFGLCVFRLGTGEGRGASLLANSFKVPESLVNAKCVRCDCLIVIAEEQRNASVAEGPSRVGRGWQIASHQEFPIVPCAHVFGERQARRKIRDPCLSVRRWEGSTTSSLNTLFGVSYIERHFKQMSNVVERQGASCMRIGLVCEYGYCLEQPLCSGTHDRVGVQLNYRVWRELNNFFVRFLTPFSFHAACMCILECGIFVWSV